ncbi:rod shape-determining protein MreC [Patescibacteria group bacterium]
MAEKKAHVRYIIIGGAALLLLIILQITGPLKPVTGAISRVLEPISYGAQSVGSVVSNFFGTIGSLDELMAENNDLKTENLRLTDQIAKLKEFEQENKDLRTQLGIAEKSSYDLIAGSVIGYTTDNIAQTILINRGERDGVKLDQAVVSPESVLVGKIIDVQASQSVVLLISDQNCRINALLQNSRATGLVSGEIGVGLKMETIPQDSILTIGEVVVTSGLGGNLPKGVVIGTIDSFSPSNNTLFQEAIVRPAVTIHDLELLFVITDY